MGRPARNNLPVVSKPLDKVFPAALNASLVLLLGAMKFLNLANLFLVFGAYLYLSYLSYLSSESSLLII